jgi:hypothetical protein
MVPPPEKSAIPPEAFVKAPRSRVVSVENKLTPEEMVV